jgi:MoxR-like ATPase
MIKKELKHKMLVSQEIVENKIFFMRGRKIMIDRDLSRLYKVKTKILNQAVKRNIERFPKDFMFILTKNETSELVTNCDRLHSLKHSTSHPYAFTEHGILMLSSVLKSKRAIHVNIQIMRTFIKLREELSSHMEFKSKITEMEKKYDHQFKIVFDAIRELLTPPEEPKRRIGFYGNND